MTAQQGWLVLSPRAEQVVIDSGHDVATNEPCGERWRAQRCFGTVAQRLAYARFEVLQEERLRQDEQSRHPGQLLLVLSIMHAEEARLGGTRERYDIGAS